MQIENTVKVWDPLVRIFHWSLVAAFFIAYITEDEFLTPHVWAGYAVLGLVTFRLLWGFIGTRHARFSDFVTAPKNALVYGRDALLGRAKRYIGHNPAGGLMIVLLLISLIVTTVTGIALYGAEEHAGPLAGLFAGAGEALEEGFEAVHEFFANFTLFLVAIHVAGVVVEGLLHRENLVRAMFTGTKRAL
jgi:cytochrome b